jgi:hypothetical protein
MPRPRFTLRERTPGTHCTGGWVSPRAGLDAEARRKILCLCWGLNLGRPVRSQTLYWLSYPGSSPKPSRALKIRVRLRNKNKKGLLLQQRLFPMWRTTQPISHCLSVLNDHNIIFEIEMGQTTRQANNHSVCYEKLIFLSLRLIRQGTERSCIIVHVTCNSAKYLVD